MCAKWVRNSKLQRKDTMETKIEFSQFLLGCFYNIKSNHVCTKNTVKCVEGGKTASLIRRVGIGGFEGARAIAPTHCKDEFFKYSHCNFQRLG